MICYHDREGVWFRELKRPLENNNNNNKTNRYPA